jgi:hypothetical protein
MPSVPYYHHKNLIIHIIKSRNYRQPWLAPFPLLS